MTPAHATSPIDQVDGPRDLLPMSSTPARAIYGLFVTTNIAFALGSLNAVEREWQAMLAVVMVCLAGLLLVSTRPHPFPLRDVFIVLSLLVGASALVYTNLATADGLGRATWQVGASTWVLFFLTMRGRTGFAWLGMAVLVLQAVEWAARAGKSPLAGIAMFDTHIGILVVGTLFAVSLRRTAQRIAAANEVSVAAASGAAATNAAAEIRHARLAELAELVTPLLDRITQDEPLSDDERRTMGRAEAQLRDGVRGRSIALPQVVEAADRARSRGVHVTLLDDRGAPIHDGAALSRLTSAIVAALDDAQDGAVTARLLPAGRSAALTILAVNGSDTVRLSIDDRGYALGNPLPPTNSAQG
ncbi:hypothetical protein ON058_01105 [Demequina sp. B12]|uniref:hypothetical protein n=1 Tax=Demequina sp. B12 TaxID=2992757 RepID=UPI00237BADD4|nr:hypothetical protein [Demequina sp. B12]MDE0572012.1 hypothetical protein [Demequina sp. B12]